MRYFFLCFLARKKKRTTAPAETPTVMGIDMGMPIPSTEPYGPFVFVPLSQQK